jgi:hypothetical protein
VYTWLLWKHRLAPMHFEEIERCTFFRDSNYSRTESAYRKLSGYQFSNFPLVSPHMLGGSRQLARGGNAVRRGQDVIYRQQ